METRTRQRRGDRAHIILDAAGAVLRRGGARALTIDAVAAEAGLSKGGVLHHYASKDALILALVARKLGELRAGIAACEPAQPPGGSALPLAMVAHARASYGEEDEVSRALMLAAVENPGALAGYRTFLADRLARMGAGGADCGQGAAILFAIVGLMMGRSLGFHDLSADEVAPLFDALERAARGIDGA